MLQRKHQVPQAGALEPDGPDAHRPAGSSPLEIVLNHGIASSAERRLVRIHDVARRRQRNEPAQRPVLQRYTEQRQLSREHLANEVRTQYRSQYVLARRTFDRLEQEILRDASYLSSSTFMAEYAYWRAYFRSAASMDGHTFQRFTVWHSRFTHHARSQARPQPVAPRRPDWRTVAEMLRACEATALVPDEEPRSAPEPRVSLLSIGTGLARPASPRRDRRRDAGVAR